jgi:hypothetical protein
MRLIITDLTEMSAGNYCVAGWHARTQRMIRPLPGGRNWTAASLAQFGINPGATIAFTPTGQTHPGAYPHSTEDTVVDAANISFVSVGPINWAGPQAPPTFATVSQAFPQFLTHNSVWNGARQGVYVPVASQIGSLSAVVLPKRSITFVEDVYRQEPPKLKALLDDGQSTYKVPISSTAIKTAWRNGGLTAARAALPTSAHVHVRLGLARAFDSPPHKCYLMVNGIHG